jgi:tetratricopeptide (TPR) repeat protein
MSDDLEVKNAPLIRSVRRGPDLPTLPVDQLEFIGRTRELEQLTAHFADDKRSRVIALIGLGGIGKTTLATVFAHRIASSFPDGVFFHRAEGEDIQEIISETIRRLVPTARIPSDEYQSLSLYRHLLAGKRVLTILDDVESEQIVRLLIPPAPSALLVTSRRNLALPDIAKVQLGALTVEEAVTLLRTSLDPKRKFEAAELVQIAEALHQYPLALRVAAAHLNSNPQVSIPEWLSLISTQVSTQENGRPIKEFIERSIARVSESGRVPRERIGMLGVFEGSFTFDAARAIWEVDERTARANLDALTSMVVMQEGRLDIHDVVKSYLRETFSQEIDASRPRHAAYFLSELRQIADRYHDPSERPSALEAFEAGRADIEAGHAWAEQTAPTSAAAGNLLIGYATAGFELLASQLPAAKWVGWINSALKECRKTSRQEDQSLLLYALGVALINQGDVAEAQIHLRDCIEIARARNDRGIESVALGALGLVYSLMGKMNEAIRCYEENLVIARSISDFIAEANAIGNLGIAYANIGNIAQAVECFERQLVMARSLSDTAGEANAIGNLGLCRRAQNDLEGARRLFEEQLVLSRKLSNLRGEASALSNLGSVMLSLGDLMRAIEAFEEAISIARQLNDRWQEGRLIGNLGNAYLAAGQIAAATDAYAQQTEIARHNGDRIGEGNALWNSAIAFEANGNIEVAIARAKAAFDIRRELNDPNLEKTVAWLRAHGVEENAH